MKTVFLQAPFNSKYCSSWVPPRGTLSPWVAVFNKGFCRLNTNFVRSPVPKLMNTQLPAGCDCGVAVTYV